MKQFICFEPEYCLIDSTHTGVLISPQPDQEGKNLPRQKNVIFIYHIYNHNWRNITTIHMCIYVCVYMYIYQDQKQTKYSRHQTNYIGKQVGLRTYQHQIYPNPVHLQNCRHIQIDTRTFTKKIKMSLCTSFGNEMSRPNFAVLLK